MPGNSRRFIAKNGSGKVLSLINAATTVVGTVALCQPFGEKPSAEIVAPFASTFAEDCRLHESRRRSLSGPEFRWPVEVPFAANSKCEPKNRKANKRTNRDLRRYDAILEVIVLRLTTMLRIEPAKPAGL